MAGHLQPSERALVGASGFASLWAVAWLGAQSASVGPAIGGGFAVGGVMASSGLAALWWRTRTMRALHGEDDEEKS